MITSAPLLPLRKVKGSHTHTRQHTQRRLGLPPPECFPVAQSAWREQSPAIVCCVHLVDPHVCVLLHRYTAHPQANALIIRFYCMYGVWNDDICVTGLKLSEKRCLVPLFCIFKAHHFHAINECISMGQWFFLFFYFFLSDLHALIQYLCEVANCFMTSY